MKIIIKIFLWFFENFCFIIWYNKLKTNFKLLQTLSRRAPPSVVDGTIM